MSAAGISEATPVCSMICKVSRSVEVASYHNETSNVTSPWVISHSIKTGVLSYSGYESIPPLGQLPKEVLAQMQTMTDLDRLYLESHN